MATENRDRRTEQPRQREVAGTSQRQPARRSEDDFGQFFNPAEFFSNPFAVMRRMHDDMDRMFAGVLGRQAGSSAMGGLGSWTPTLEVSEKDNEICVCAELPGLKPEDVKIEVTDDALIIHGERKQEIENEQRGEWRSERHYGRFYRAVPLPEGANAEQAHADFKNGELRVTIPVERSQGRRRQIPISAGAGQAERSK